MAIQEKAEQNTPCGLADGQQQQGGREHAAPNTEILGNWIQQNTKGRDVDRSRAYRVPKSARNDDPPAILRNLTHSMPGQR
jgi:hypothetical protein